MTIAGDDNTRLDEIRKDDGTAAYSSLVHPVVFPFEDEHSTSVYNPLACGAHFLGQNRSTTVGSTDWIGVEVCRQRARTNDLSTGVATGVADVFSEAHVDGL